MKSKLREIISIASGLVVLILLIWLSLLDPPGRQSWLPSIFFMVLVVFTTTFGAPLGGGWVSLMPMVSLAAYLVVGLIPAGWVAFLSALLHGAIRQAFAKQLGLKRELFWSTSLSITSTNAAIQTASILGAGVVYQALGGVIPFTQFDPRTILVLLGGGLTYLFYNYSLAGLFIAARGGNPLREYIRAVAGVAIYEGAPLLFAPLLAMVYTHFGSAVFLLSALAIAATAFMTRNLALARQRFERQLVELEGLQAVGQALSSSLDLNEILMAVYRQVARLMPAESFYVAIYDPENDEVTFPLAIEYGEQVQWPSRKGGRGLTEYILRTQSPLLSREKTDVIRRQLGLSKSDRPATSWLGVPILAGDELLGVISVQSFSAFDLYDSSHQEILTMIASQASVAIQNAHLYANTDKALARRVQEMDSILRTVREGILLLDPEGCVLAVNRALADFVRIPRLALIDGSANLSQLDGYPSLFERIGYTERDFQMDCAKILEDGEEEFKVDTITISGPSELQVERTLTPVRDGKGNVTGWLMVFRDLTDEINLEHEREDMLHMLIHDLRSPLSVLQGSLNTIKSSLEDGSTQNIDDLLRLAQRGSDRVLRLVNELLDIGKLESDQITLDRDWLDVKSLLGDACSQMAPAAERAQIGLEIIAGEDLPSLYVDRKYIERVLINLLDNAVKFTSDGGRIIAWARLEPDHDPLSVLIGVTDTGPGIPKETQDRLFGKFQQVSTIHGRRSGTGLGLHYCKLAVEAHGGNIWVDSEPGEGSTFTLRLPVA